MDGMPGDLSRRSGIWHGCLQNLQCPSSSLRGPSSSGTKTFRRTRVLLSVHAASTERRSMRRPGPGRAVLHSCQVGGVPVKAVIDRTSRFIERRKVCCKKSSPRFQNPAWIRILLTVHRRMPLGPPRQVPDHCHVGSSHRVVRRHERRHFYCPRRRRLPLALEIVPRPPLPDFNVCHRFDIDENATRARRESLPRRDAGVTSWDFRRSHFRTAAREGAPRPADGRRATSDCRAPRPDRMRRHRN